VPVEVDWPVVGLSLRKSFSLYDVLPVAAGDLGQRLVPS
jgi:hypothetical protein